MAERDPQSKVRKLQHEVYQNAKEAEDARRELGSWFRDIGERDAALLKENSVARASEAFPVRTAAADIGSGASDHNIPDNSSTNGSAKPARIKSSDYGAWEKFDVDRACDDLEYETAPKTASVTAQTSAMLPSSSLDAPSGVTAAKVKRAEFEKNMGNQMFESGKYADAVIHYSRALEYDSENAVYPANRAMANLKLNKFEEAEADCSVALKLDPKYIKAYHRRATARLSLKNLADAKKDFNAVLALDPKNKDAKDKLQVILKWEEKHLRSAPVGPLGRITKLPSTKSEGKVVGDIRVVPPITSFRSASTSSIVREDGKIKIFPRVYVALDVQSTLKKISIRDADEKEDMKSGFPRKHSKNVVVLPRAVDVVSTDIPIHSVASDVSSPCVPATAQLDDRPVFLRSENGVTSASFFQACQILSRSRDFQQAGDYIKNLEPRSYSALIGQNLELEIFLVILYGCLGLFERNQRDLSLQHLSGLSKVARFSFFVYCIPGDIKKTLSDAFHALRDRDSSDEAESVLDDVSKKYLINS